MDSSKKDFLTLRSSDTNFTHTAPIFGRLPKKCLVSPRLSSRNIKLLKELITEFDRLRLVTIAPKYNSYNVQITLASGKVIRKMKIRRYTCKWGDLKLFS